MTYSKFIAYHDAGWMLGGLAAYPFQRYGMLTGKVIRVSADATENVLVIRIHSGKSCV